MSDPSGEVTELLRRLIRNACVNDGTPDSGHESRNADTLAAYLEGCGLALRRFEPHPGRVSLVARLEGRDPKAPTLLLMGHTDVVPANPAGWTRDPFAAELVDGVVWGRGAIDMLNITASMAVALRRIATSAQRPRGTLLYLAVADEEALGAYGAGWLTAHAWDDVRADYVVTEFGGMPLPLSATPGAKLAIHVGEKGYQWLRVRVRGAPGHGSMPYRTDNAVVRAAEAIRRIAAYRPPPRLHETWRRFVERMAFAPDLAAALADPEGVTRTLPTLPVGLARMFDALTRTTFAPTIVHGGTKTNIIPDEAIIGMDVRTLPGDGPRQVRAMVAEALGDLAAAVAIEDEGDNAASASSADTPLWDALTRATGTLVPGAITVPSLIMGATDARYFRRRGAVAYGYGLYSERIPLAEFMTLFHGNDERVDLESLRLSTELWERAARILLA